MEGEGITEGWSGKEKKEEKKEVEGGERMHRVTEERRLGEKRRDGRKN